MGCSTTTILAQLSIEPVAGAGAVHTITLSNLERDGAHVSLNFKRRRLPRAICSLPQCGVLCAFVNYRRDCSSIALVAVLNPKIARYCAIRAQVVGDPRSAS